MTLDLAKELAASLGGKDLCGGAGAPAPIGPFDTYIENNKPASRWWRPADVSAGATAAIADYMHGESMSQAAPAQQPTRGLGINGHASLGFVRASSQYLAGAPVIAGLMAIVQPMTAFYVVKHGATAFTGGYALGFGRVVGLTRSYSFGTNNDVTGTFGMIRGNTNLGSSPAMNGLVKVVSVTYDGTTQKVRVNGTPNIVTAAGDTSSAQPFDLTVFGCKWLSGTAQSFFDGQLGDVLIVPEVLSDAAILAGEAHFAAKFA